MGLAVHSPGTTGEAAQTWGHPSSQDRAPAQGHLMTRGTSARDAPPHCPQASPVCGGACGHTEKTRGTETWQAHRGDSGQRLGPRVLLLFKLSCIFHFLDSEHL